MLKGKKFDAFTLSYECFEFAPQLGDTTVPHFVREA